MTGVPDDVRSKAKRYQATRLRLLPVRLLASLALPAIALAGPSQALAAYLRAAIGNSGVVVAAYFILYTLVFTVWLLPLNFFQGHVVEKKFALSTESAGSWLADWAKGLAVSVALGLPIVVLVYWLIRAAPHWWWIAAAVAVSVFGVVLANAAPVLIYPIFFKFQPLDDEQIRGRLAALAERSGTPFSGIYRMELSVKSSEAEALLTGMGRTRRIVLSDTLLANYRIDEIEVILAHELGHHALRHLPLLVGVQAVGAFAALYVLSIVLRAATGTMGLAAAFDVANLPLVFMVVTAMQAVAMPIGNWFSRRLESRADDFALSLTSNPAAFACAMRKLADQNLADVDPAPAVEFMIYSHPSIGHRIEAAKRFARERGLAVAEETAV